MASQAKHGGKRCAEAIWLCDTTIPLKLGDRVRVGEVFGDGPHPERLEWQPVGALLFADDDLPACFSHYPLKIAQTP